jgi:hypothetical protein
MDQDQAKNDLPGLTEADQQKVADAAAEQTFSYSYSGSSLQRIGYTLSVSTFRIFFRIFLFLFRLNLICFFFCRASIRIAPMSTNNKEMAWNRKWYAFFIFGALVVHLTDCAGTELIFVICIGAWITRPGDGRNAS